MSRYCINTLGCGAGYKVQIADTDGGLRVVGIFANEADAKAWIAVDKAVLRAAVTDHPHFAAASSPVER